MISIRPPSGGTVAYSDSGYAWEPALASVAAWFQTCSRHFKTKRQKHRKIIAEFFLEYLARLDRIGRA
jgi:hypothetical protein